MQATILRDSQSLGVFNPFERTAGTKALMVPEILNIILSFSTRSTLASAARVSKAWSSIALDQLWSGHDVKILDLLQVLPISYTQDLYSPQRTWKLMHDPTEEEWARFRSYASRVRSLVFPKRSPDHFDSRITEWKVEKEVLFLRLRRIEACFQGSKTQPFSQLLQFITPGLREFYLSTGMFGPTLQSLLDVLATSEGLHLQKLKLSAPWRGAGMAQGDAVANLAVANAASIKALEVSFSLLNASLITEHPLLSLRALSFTVELLGGGGDKHPIQLLVEGCPHVAYLIIRSEHVLPTINLLDLPGFRMILTWHLLSLEIQPIDRFDLTEANMDEMSRAWPKLKKLNLTRMGIRPPLPYSRLADIVSAFPQLEDIGVSLYYEKAEEDLLATYQLSPEHRRLSRLRKLRLSNSLPPGSESERDLVARFLSRVLPPVLRIDRDYRWTSALDPVKLAEAQERAAATGRDIDPEWDALFRQIEELQGGAPIWAGTIPEDNDGVWF